MTRAAAARMVKAVAWGSRHRCDRPARHSEYGADPCGGLAAACRDEM